MTNFISRYLKRRRERRAAPYRSTGYNSPVSSGYYQQPIYDPFYPIDTAYTVEAPVSEPQSYIVDTPVSDSYSSPSCDSYSSYDSGSSYDSSSSYDSCSSSSYDSGSSSYSSMD